MTLANTSNAILVLPRGELYFDRFAAGTLVGEGEMYLGNTPGFSLSRSFEETKRYRSYGGQVLERDAIVTQDRHTGEIETDNISVDNMGLWFGGAVTKPPQISIGMYSETFTVNRGRFFQIGLTIIPFVGIRHLYHVGIVVRKGATVVPEAGNYSIDLERARIFVEASAPNIANGDSITIDFEWRESEPTQVVPSGKEVVGALRFISTNPFGPEISYYFPSVRLKAKGDIELKRDDFLSLNFDIDVRRKTPAAEFFYVTQHAAAGLTRDENAIISDGGISLTRFPFFEDVLDETTNHGLFWATLGATETAFPAVESDFDAIINQAFGSSLS